MPENIGEMPRLLALMYNCAQVIKNSAQFLKKNAASVNLNPFSNDGYFSPLSFVSEIIAHSKKKGFLIVDSRCFLLSVLYLSFYASHYHWYHQYIDYIISGILYKYCYTL
ncbi:unnamed protein product [Rhizopus stolonifer]